MGGSKSEGIEVTEQWQYEGIVVVRPLRRRLFTCE